MRGKIEERETKNRIKLERKLLEKHYSMTLNKEVCNGCGVCAGRVVVKSNCLATLNPKLAREWHPTKNGKLAPNNVVPGSYKKVWWKCPKGDDHEWRTSVECRSYGSGCPICSNRKVVKSNCLATLNPRLAKEWHPTKNGDLTPKDVTSSSGKKVWWKCSKGHEWATTVNHRSNGRGCPYCSGRRRLKNAEQLTFF